MIRLLVKPLLILGIVVAIVYSLFLLIERQNTSLFKIPIAVEDKDNSVASKQWISAIEKSTAVNLQKVDEQFLNAEQLVENNDVAIAITIPKGYAENLKQNQMTQTVELYQAKGIVSTIATEVVSRALYEQQIPFIIKKYIEKEITFQEVQRAYTENQPKSILKKNVYTKNLKQPNYVMSLLIIITFFILISQLFIFNKLRQFTTLQRMGTYRLAKTKLFIVYTASLLVMLVCVLFLITTIFNESFSIIHTIIWLLIYQIVASFILFQMRTTSHALFLFVFWSVCCSGLYIGNQLLGGVI